jgi:hypothetical protein
MLIAASAASLTLISALAGCSEVREVPVTDLRPFRPISSSCVDTAETRKEIRAHNSVLASLKTGKRVVYSDPCPPEKPTS